MLATAKIWSGKSKGMDCTAYFSHYHECVSTCSYHTRGRVRMLFVPDIMPSMYFSYSKNFEWRRQGEPTVLVFTTVSVRQWETAFPWYWEEGSLWLVNWDHAIYGWLWAGAFLAGVFWGFMIEASYTLNQEKSWIGVVTEDGVNTYPVFQCVSYLCSIIIQCHIY